MLRRLFFPHAAEAQETGGIFVILHYGCSIVFILHPLSISVFPPSLSLLPSLSSHQEEEEEEEEERQAAKRRRLQVSCTINNCDL